MKKSVAILSCLFTLFFGAQAHAGFVFEGYMESKNLNLSVGGTFENNGTLFGTEALKLSCGTLVGTGLIKSDKVVSIRTKEFGFTGDIEYTERCVITVKEDFDRNICSFKGPVDEDGKMVAPEVTVDPTLWSKDETKSWVRSSTSVSAH